MTDVVLRSKGKRYPVKIEVDDRNRLVFRRSPFALKNEIKCMKGARWNADARWWTATNCPRNMFQIRYMMVEPTNENPYDWFERPLVDLDPATIVRPLKDHQIEMICKQLTYRYQIHAADMGLGKTLTAIEIWERLAALYGWSPDEVQDKVWFVGPKSALESVELDMYKWAVTHRPTLKTYERLLIDYNQNPDVFPQVIFFDECSSLKNPSALRSRCAQDITDKIRDTYGTDGSVALLSGTVTAKRPSDIWSQAEIAWPGFLREGSLKAFKFRYAIMEEGEDVDGNKFMKEAGWRDDQVEKLPARLKGLMSVYRKSELLNLPTRTYEVRDCPPEPRTLRIAKALVNSAPNVITGLTWLRQLSSGFQYDADGEAEGQERALVETKKCPKDTAFRDILAEEESLGRNRMIGFASFQGSIDRVKRICHSEGWDTITVDGRGWNCHTKDGDLVKQHILDFWANNGRKTVLVGNPASCRYGLTLIEAKTIVVYDQNFSAEYRIQSNDRNYRIGQDTPVRVIDLIHLPVDRLVLDTLTENKRLEDLSLGILLESLAA